MNNQIPRDAQELILVMFRKGIKQNRIAVELGVSAKTVQRYVARLGGVPRPLDTEYDTRYLGHDERYEIARLHDAGVSMRQIGARLSRAPSTISRELARHREPRSGHYLPQRAHTRAWQRQRRPKPSKLATDALLRVEVQRLLKKRYSPEQVAGRLPVLFPDDESMRISHESIYQSLYLYPRGELTRELKAYRRSARTARRPRGKRRPHTTSWITEDVKIAQRPEEVLDRTITGHHEGDLIKGTLASNSAVGTIVERHSGYLNLIHLPEGYSAEKVAAAISTQMQPVPEWFAKTLTWDRGAELAKHAEITATTGIKVYFADPRCPQQRPSNENTNGLLREYMPKGTDLSIHTRADLDHIATELNDRPRKRLGFHTPNEVLAKLILDNPDPSVASTP